MLDHDARSDDDADSFSACAAERAVLHGDVRRAELTASERGLVEALGVDVVAVRVADGDVIDKSALGAGEGYRRVLDLGPSRSPRMFGPKICMSRNVMSRPPSMKKVIATLPSGEPDVFPYWLDPQYGASFGTKLVSIFPVVAVFCSMVPPSKTQILNPRSHNCPFTS